MGVEASEINLDSDEAVVRAAILNRRGAEPSYEPTTGHIVRYWFNGTYTECEIYGKGSGSVAAWRDARKDHFVVAFESTLRVQDAPEVVREAEGKPSIENPLDDICMCGHARLAHSLSITKWIPAGNGCGVGLCHCPSFSFKCTAGSESAKAAAKPLPPDSPEVDVFAYIHRAGGALRAVRWTGENIEEVRKVYPGIGEEYMLDKGCCIGWYVISPRPGRVYFESAEYFESRYESASLRTRPEGEAKVTWKLIRHVAGSGAYPNYFVSEKMARQRFESEELCPGDSVNLVKIETHQTVIETRTKETSRG